MRKSLIVVLVLSLLFAFLFAVGGAGIYGSPFDSVPTSYSSEVRAAHDLERLLEALTILVGPLACGVALAVHKRSPRLACIPLVLGAIAGAFLGTATKFVVVWEKVFLITVWLPMIFVALGIVIRLGVERRRSLGSLGPGERGLRHVAAGPWLPDSKEPEIPAPAMEGAIEQTRLWCRRNPILSALMATGALCLVGAIAVMWHLAAVPTGHSIARPGQGNDTSDKFIGTEAGQIRDDNGLKMELVWCPPGKFTMEQVEQIGKTTPVKVFLTRGYWLGKYEVTQAEWKQVMATDPWKGAKLTKEGDDFPATSIIWNDAMEFCRKLTQQERVAGRLSNGWEYTLPTEAQWEHGCRARTETKFSFGDDESKLGEFAWFFDNAWKAGELYAHRVGQKKPNPWGLFDMHGNAFEWCRDWYSGKLPGGNDPEVTDQIQLLMNHVIVTPDSMRVLRGGGWNNDEVRCRSGYRYDRPVANDYFHVGFRVALSAVP